MGDTPSPGWESVAEASMDGVGLIRDGEYVRGNAHLATVYGFEDPEELVGADWAAHHEFEGIDDRGFDGADSHAFDGADHHAFDGVDQGTPADAEAVLARVREGGAWRGSGRVRRRGGETAPVELSLRSTDAGVVAVVRDVTGSRERERALDRYERFVETVDDGIYALDEDLRFTFVNDGLCEMFGRSRAELLGTSAMELFAVDDEAARADEIRERVVAGDTSVGTVQATYDPPDGERRILESQYRLYPDPDGEYRGSVGVIRDVTEREERERRLERQRDELATLAEINGLLLEITRELVGTTSQEAVERTLCDQLVGSDRYELAWVGEPGVAGDVDRRASAGADGYLDAVTVTAGGSETGTGPVARALRTGEVAVATVDAPEFAPRRTAAREHGFEAAAAVPLRHGETVYGVLAVYAAQPDAFSEREQAGFAVLGQTVGFVINALKRRDLLFAEAVTELEFRVSDPASPVVRLSDDLDCALSLAGYVPADDGWLLYLEVEGATATAAVDAAGDAVAHARVVTDEDGDRRIEAAVGGESLFETVTAGGATVRSIEASSGAGTLVVELPATGGVRAFVGQVRAAHPGSELVARREHERTPDHAGTPDDYLGGLTDRQRRALEAAYRAGYFDWPRESTAEEVAAVLDVAPPTLHAHLRKAEARLFGALFDGQ